MAETSKPVLKLAHLVLLVLVLTFVGLASIISGASGLPKPITILVKPKVATTDNYKHQTFHVQIVVPRHKDNKLLSYSASCGSEIRTSEYNVDKVAWDWLEEFTVTENCIFQACLHRAVEGKVKNYCDYVEVSTSYFEP